MPVFIHNKWQTHIPDDFFNLLSTGQGVFETMLFSDRIIWFWEEHSRRLLRSLRFFNRPEPSFDLQSVVTNALKEWDPDSVLRIKLIVVFPFSDEPLRLTEEHLAIQIIPLLPKDLLSSGSVRLQTRPSPFADHFPLQAQKTLPYSNTFFLKGMAHKKGFNDVLFYTSKGYIKESSTSNIFAVKDKKLFTPSLAQGILPGTVRELLLELFNGKEEMIHLHDLPQYDFFFLSSSIKQLRLVNAIDQTDFEGKTGFFAQIQHTWGKYCQQHLKETKPFV